MCWSNSSKTLSWLGVLWGLLSLATLLTAFLSNVWLYTKEPIRFPNNDILTTVTFKIGLWRICHSFKRTNSTPYVPSSSCSFLKYSNWDDITASDLGISSSLEFTPSFLSKMRISVPFGAISIIFILLATVFALAGLYSGDHKTLVACGLYMLGGLTLGGGLLIFASVLSDAYFERPRKSHVINDAFEKVMPSSLFDYKYGWSFFAAGAAFFMSELAAVLSISAYIRRFPTVEDMVRVMVPGAERRLKERQGLAGEYLVQHQNKYQRHEPDTSVSLTSGLSTKCYNKNEVLPTSDLEGVEGTLILAGSKPAPDICASNPSVIVEDAIGFTSAPSASSNIMAAKSGGYCLKSEPLYILDESNVIPNDSSQIDLTSSLAGQTVPIVLMNHPQRSLGPPFMYSPSNLEGKKNFKTSKSPISETPKFEGRHNTVTLPSRQIRRINPTDSMTLDHNLHLQQFRNFDDNISDSHRFELNHISSDLDSSMGTFFGTFHGEGTYFQSNTLEPLLDVPGASSTTSSSSGTGSGTTITMGSSQSSTSRKSVSSASEKRKKKSVTIGNVFSTMDTFEPSNGENEFFDSGSAV